MQIDLGQRLWYGGTRFFVKPFQGFSILSEPGYPGWRCADPGLLGETPSGFFVAVDFVLGSKFLVLVSQGGAALTLGYWVKPLRGWNDASPAYFDFSL